MGGRWLGIGLGFADGAGSQVKQGQPQFGGGRIYLSPEPDLSFGR